MWKFACTRFGCCRRAGKTIKCWMNAAGDGRLVVDLWDGGRFIVNPFIADMGPSVWRRRSRNCALELKFHLIISRLHNQRTDDEGQCEIVREKLFVIHLPFGTHPPVRLDQSIPSFVSLDALYNIHDCLNWIFVSNRWRFSVAAECVFQTKNNSKRREIYKYLMLWNRQMDVSNAHLTIQRIVIFKWYLWYCVLSN